MRLELLSPEQLKKYVRTLSAGEMLFEQNDLGNTMFIIVSGSVTVLEKRNDAQFVVGTLTSGQVLGEKAMLSEAPYRRTYSVRAESTVTLLEFDFKNLKLVENIIPDFTSRMFQMAARRLDRANKIISLLRSMDPIERVINSIVFLTQEDGKRTPDGVEVSLTEDDLFHISHVDRAIIKDCLDLLQRSKIIRPQKDLMLVPDLNALLQFAPELKERIAA